MRDAILRGMELLDNIVWNALSGPQARFSAGGASARRYAVGFSPILAFADLADPDFDALAAHCAVGEQFYCADWTGPAPVGWRIDVDSTMHRMVYEGPMPETDAAPDAIPLRPQHAQVALALALLTKPGPFGPRTIELGDYFGLFENGQLVAMAGERMHAPGLREVSGVCTDPGHQGKGLARRLMDKLLRLQMQRGEQPFLHVMSANSGALALYRKMGFRTWREGAIRVLTRLG